MALLLTSLASWNMCAFLLKQYDVLCDATTTLFKVVFAMMNQQKIVVVDANSKTN